MSSAVLTVSQVNSYIKTMLDGDKRLSNVFINGEISNFNNNYKSGHLYFSLKDDKALIKAVMFSSNANKLRFLPKDGMKVIVTGRISVYEASGQYQVYVNSMQPDGIGALAIAFEQLKNKLSAEGLFDESHKLALPEFPKKIGVITSPTGAVLQDIKNVISRRYPIAEVVLCPVTVQGESAAKELTAAVKKFNAVHSADVIIIGRGGGSFEDLNCFNDELLVREIYNSKIPVISAVGHETDFTLCDFVADLRAPTPSAAAELAVPDIMQLEQYINDIYIKMHSCMERKLYTESQALDALSDNFSIEKIKLKINGEIGSVAFAEKQINSLFKNMLSIKHLQIDNFADKLTHLSPTNVLKRGYSYVKKDGLTVSSAARLSVNDSVSLEFVDGYAFCTVNEVDFKLDGDK